MTLKMWALTAIATFAAIVYAVMLPHLSVPIAVTWTLLMLALGSIALTSTTRRAMDVLLPGFDRVVRRRRWKPARPEDLERLERSLGWRTYAPREFDTRVRPLLRELIAGKLKERYRVDITTDPGSASKTIDGELLAIAGDTRAADIYERSLETADIASIVRRIEEI